MTRRVDDHRIDLALRLLADATGSGVGEPQRVQDALRKLLTWTPEYAPSQFSTRAKSGYRKGDETAPFFSESYLYVLLGKEPARSLLNLVTSLCEALGFNYTEQAALMQPINEERPKLLLCTGVVRGVVLECRDYTHLREMQNPLEWGAGILSCYLAPGEDPQKKLVEEDERRAAVREAERNRFSKRRS